MFFKEINFKKVLIIIITSSFIGLTYNYFNPFGIAISKDKRVLKFQDENSQIEKNNYESKKNISKHIDDADLQTTKEKSIDNQIKNNNEPALTKPSGIKLNRAYQLFKQGVTFIDARPIEEFANGHIKGAINIPFYGSENYESVLNKISKQEVIVTYCTGEECELSILLGDELFSKGYQNVYIFFGGWNDWQKNNYPINKE